MTTINLDHVEQPTEKARLIHAHIFPDPENVRSDDRTDIESLAQSILINGLIQPSERYAEVLNRIGFDVTDDGKLVITETGEVVDVGGN